MSGEKKRGQGSRRERVGVYIDTERTNRFALKKKKKTGVIQCEAGMPVRKPLSSK